MSIRQKAISQGLAKLAALEEFIARAPEIAAEAFANGGVGVGTPIVDDRFKGQGNSRFPRRKVDPSKSKAKQLRKGMRAKGRIVSRSVQGTLPVLVRTGRLRSSVSDRKHRITLRGDVAIIHFKGLPDYALYHHLGSGKLPKRSPVEPNGADERRIALALKKALDAMLGTAPVGASRQYGRARVIT